MIRYHFVVLMLLGILVLGGSCHDDRIALLAQDVVVQQDLGNRELRQDVSGGETSGVCGDGTCRAEENSLNCPTDCKPRPCGNGQCEAGENPANCPQDCENPCGNGECEAGENPLNCPQDCDYVCGNGKCEYGEDPSGCPEDCKTPCGNGECEAGENPLNCPEDCGPACGNGDCEQGEDPVNCPEDCKTPCGNGECEAGENPLNCPQDCDYVCGNGKCEYGEDPINCPEDCKTPCGNGECEAGENPINCPQDCDYVCGNGKCEYGEGPDSCPVDCAPVCGDGNCNSGEQALCPQDCCSNCDDGLACTEGKCQEEGKDCFQVVQEGFCLLNNLCIDGGMEKLDSPCMTCQPALSKTTWSPVDGGVCDDEDPCTTNDQCAMGVCSGLAKNCDDENNCTKDQCVEGDCINEPLSGAGCLDNNPCTLFETCLNGHCIATLYDDACPSTCGDGICTFPDDSQNCPEDCGFCGDAICGEWEGKGEYYCAKDCGAFCGNGSCESEEKPDTCAADCGPCGDGICGFNDFLLMCESHDCPSGCGDTVCALAESSETCPKDCGTACGDGACSASETPTGCPVDCGTCGDGTCGVIGEEVEDCPQDCVEPCGDGLCAGGETQDSCPYDCGFCGDNVCGSVEMSEQSCPKDCLVSCGNGHCEEEWENADVCPFDCWCVVQCDPAWECGVDTNGCNQPCGACAMGQQWSCVAHKCICEPECTNKQCGDDGCGGKCGNCGACLETCEDGICVFHGCDGKECGSDDCGGSCGNCQCGETCDEGSCVFHACDGLACGTDGCGASCGECGCGEVCEAGHCLFTACDNKECGADGCGGQCLCDDPLDVCLGGQCEKQNPVDIVFSHECPLPDGCSGFHPVDHDRFICRETSHVNQSEQCCDMMDPWMEPWCVTTWSTATTDFEVTLDATGLCSAVVENAKTDYGAESVWSFYTQNMPPGSTPSKVVCTSYLNIDPMMCFEQHDSFCEYDSSDQCGGAYLCDSPGFQFACDVSNVFSLATPWEGQDYIVVAGFLDVDVQPLAELVGIENCGVSWGIEYGQLNMSVEDMIGQWGFGPEPVIVAAGQEFTSQNGVVRRFLPFDFDGSVGSISFPNMLGAKSIVEVSGGDLLVVGPAKGGVGAYEGGLDVELVSKFLSPLESNSIPIGASAAVLDVTQWGGSMLIAGWRDSAEEGDKKHEVFLSSFNDLLQLQWALVLGTSDGLPAGHLLPRPDGNLTVMWGDKTTVHIQLIAK